MITTLAKMTLQRTQNICTRRDLVGTHTSHRAEKSVVSGGCRKLQVAVAGDSLRRRERERKREGVREGEEEKRRNSHT